MRGSRKDTRARDPFSANADRLAAGRQAARTSSRIVALEEYWRGGRMGAGEKGTKKNELRKDRRVHRVAAWPKQLSREFFSCEQCDTAFSARPPPDRLI